MTTRELNDDDVNEQQIQEKLKLLLELARSLKLKLNVSQKFKINSSERCLLEYSFMTRLICVSSVQFNHITLAAVLRLLSVGQSGIQSASDVRLLFELRLTLREFFPSAGGSTCLIDCRRRSI